MSYNVFQGDWKNIEDVISAFGDYESDSGPRTVLTDPGTTILYAGYAAGSYEGAGTLVYRKENGDIIINEGGHCSCYGMSDYWDPNIKPVTAEYLRTMAKNPAKDDYVYYGGDAGSVEAWNAMVASL